MKGIIEISSNEKFNSQKFNVSDVFDPQLDEQIPVEYKEWGIPFPYMALLSPYFDVKPAKFKNKLISLAEAEIPNSSQQEDLRVPGPISGMEIYEELSSVFSEEFQTLLGTEVLSSDQELIKTKGATKILVHPFKLAIYLSQYAKEMDKNFEIIDVINEFIDKLFLIGVLPYVFENLDTYLLLDKPTWTVKQGSASKFIEAISKDLNAKVDDFLTNDSFFEDDCYLEITKSQLKKLLGKGGDFNDEEQLFIGIEDLDDLLSKQLHEKYQTHKRKNEKKAADDKKSEIEFVASWPEEKVVYKRYFRTGLFKIGMKTAVRLVTKTPIETSTHHWLYKPTRGLSAAFISGLSLNTLEFNNDGYLPPPTVTDDIDLRPQVWAKTAFNLAAEKFVFEKRSATGKALINNAKSLEDIYQVDDAYRSDWETYGEVLAEIDALRAEVAEFGYEINLENADDKSKTKLGIFRTTTYRYTQCVTRYRTEITRHKRRYGPFWRRRTKRWTTKRRIPFKTTITKIGTKPTPIYLDWDPIRTYLNEIVDKNTYTIFDSDGKENAIQTTQAKNSLIEALKNVKGDTGIKIETLKNGDKDFRIFSIFNNQLLDQYGNDLATVMREAEDATLRSTLLLLLPVVEVNESGSSNITSYKAIHNPIGFRNSYSIPSVVIHEELEQTISEDTSYYLGPLAHTETLLPGEKRYLNIKTTSNTTRNVNSSTSQTTQQNSKSSNSLQDRTKKEVTDVVRKSQQTSWSISASGSGNFGFAKVGGSASTKGSKSKSSENTVNRLNDRVSKVMNETSQRNELTINTSTSESSQFSESQEKKIEIENFNTGRSVTHRFHQVMRKYISDSKIKELKVLVTYDEEFIAGYGYRKSELIPLIEIDKILPEMIEAERKTLINALKNKIKEQYPEVTLENELLIFPENGITLPKNSWYVNSGSFVIETDMANKEVLEDYVKDMRKAQIEKINAEGNLFTSKAEAIKEGHTVLPMHTSNFNVSADSPIDPNE